MDGLFDASAHRAVAAGSCVMINESEIVYAGPLQNMPEADGKMILLHPEDFAKLAGHIDRQSHNVLAKLAFGRRH